MKRLLPSGLDEFTSREALRPDLGRALRCTAAFMLPVVLMHLGRLPALAAFSAIAAQNVAIIDVRGPYRLRFGLLLAITLVLTLATQLGVWAGAHVLSAVLFVGVIGASMGVWRHLSSDYGPGLAVSSSLLYLIAIATPAADTMHPGPAMFTLGGALWGFAIQAALWPWRAQHPLRRAVAESWTALGDLFAEMAREETRQSAAPSTAIAELEAALRTTLDRTYATLAAARIGRTHAFHARLEQLHLAAARLATRAVVLDTALDPLRGRLAFASLTAAVQPALVSFTNLCRGVALTVISRQPGHLATCEVRLQRLGNLLRALPARLTAQAPGTPEVTQLAELLRQIALDLPALRERVRATVDRAAERGAFSLELFDVNTWSLRPLAATLHLRPRIDRTLVRFTARLTVLLMLGVALFKGFDLPHGYWLPLTAVVVLQPDYGSTRRRAAQRLLGTLTGGVIASALLWLELPAAALIVATAAAVFGFSYYVRSRYALAVFYVTVMVVFLIEPTIHTASHMTIAAERLLATAAGGVLAMFAALLFWPVWEAERFPPILAHALQANRDYWQILRSRLAAGGAYDDAVIAAKRAAETANSDVFSSLQRMFGDPKNRQENLEQSAALANGNQRLTRAFTGLALHLSPEPGRHAPELGAFADLTARALAGIATAAEHGPSALPPGELARLLHAVESAPLPDGSAAADQREQWILAQLSRAATELTAMLVAADQLAAADRRVS